MTTTTTAPAKPVSRLLGIEERPSWQEKPTAATKGAKDYHWAMIEVTPDDTPDGHDDGHAFLLLRRHRYTGTISYYLGWSPQPVPLAKLIDVAVDQVTGERDEVGRESVRAVDDALHERAVDGQADVQIRQLHDREAVE